MEDTPIPVKIYKDGVEQDWEYMDEAGRFYEMERSRGWDDGDTLVRIDIDTECWRTRHQDKDNNELYEGDVVEAWGGICLIVFEELKVGARTLRLKNAPLITFSEKGLLSTTRLGNINDRSWYEGFQKNPDVELTETGDK